MKINIVEREASTFRGIEATKTRSQLSGLRYDLDSKVLTMAEFNEVLECAKKHANDILNNSVWEYQRVLEQVRRDMLCVYLGDANKAEVIAAARIFFVTYYHAGIEKFSEQLQPEDDGTMECMNASAPALLIGAYTACTGWLRKIFHAEKFTPEQIDSTMSLLNVTMHYSGYTSCDQDRVLRSTVLSGLSLDSHRIGMVYQYMYHTYQERAVPAPLTASVVLRDCGVPLFHTIVANLQLHALAMRMVVYTDEGPMWFGYKNAADLMRATPYLAPLGKALAAMKVDNEVIKDALLRFKASEADVELVIYPNDCRFKHAYRLAHEQGSITSCMSKTISHYHCGKSPDGFEYYPVDAYSAAYFVEHDNGLALFTLVRDTKVIARAIVNVDKMQAVRFYGSHKLPCILKQMGIVQDNYALDEVHLPQLINTDGDLIGPYLDGYPDNVTLNTPTSRLMQITSSGDICMTDTYGYYNVEGTAHCDLCGAAVHEDDICWLDGSEEYCCTNCYENEAHECAVDGLRYREGNMSWIMLDDSYQWVADSNIDELYRDDVEGCNTYYSTIDDMVETTEGYLTHIDNAVQLKDETWVLSSNYNRAYYGPRMDEDDEEEEDDE